MKASDLETPALPPGHYFLVYKTYYHGWTYYCLAVYLKRKWWGDKCVEDVGRVVCTDRNDARIKEVLLHYMQTTANKLARRDFSGSYPPNKL